jgi:aspartate 1-decarboxylase
VNEPKKKRIKTRLSAKLHRVRATHADRNYVGSVAIDKDWMDRADIEENEQVHIVNLTNGNRWVTYAIPAPAGSRILALNGGGAFLGETGDALILMTYVQSDEPIIPELIFFNEKNEILGGSELLEEGERHVLKHPDITETIMKRRW